MLITALFYTFIIMGVIFCFIVGICVTEAVARESGFFAALICLGVTIYLMILLVSYGWSEQGLKAWNAMF